MLAEAQLQQDLTAAMKARDMETVYVLRGLLTAIKNFKVEKQVQEVPEAELAVLVRKEINRRDEAIEFARKGNRDDVVAENERQKAVLDRYLPQQLSREELEKAVADLSAELGTTAIGPLMTKLRERYPGRFDGKLASEIIRSRQ